MPAKRKLAAPVDVPTAVVAAPVDVDVPTAVVAAPVDVAAPVVAATKVTRTRVARKKVETAATPPTKPTRAARRIVVHEVVNAKSTASTHLLSPRTTVSRFVEKGVLDDPRNVKVAVNSLALNLGYAVKAALLIGENGTCTINGKVYTKKELSELSNNLTRSVKRLPSACRQSGSSKRFRHRSETLGPDEMEVRRKVLHERMVTAANALGAACEIPKIVPALIAKGEARINARLADTSSTPRVEIGAIEKPFYISDTFRRFIAKGEFGNGWAFLYTLPPDAAIVSGAQNPDAALEAATKALGFDPAKKLGLSPAEAKKVSNPYNIFCNLLVERGIATSPILMSLMSAYINAGKLRDSETNRIRVDESMVKFLGKGTTTEHIYSKVNFTPTDLNDTCKLSGLERLSLRETKTGVKPYDGTTFTRPMNIVLANYYRISKSEEGLASKLSNLAIMNLCLGVKLFL